MNNSSYFKATYLKKKVSYFLRIYSSMFTDGSFPLIIFKLFSTVTKNVRLTQLEGDKGVKKKKKHNQKKPHEQVHGPPFLM